MPTGGLCVLSKAATALLLLVTCLGRPVEAQGTSGAITGTVHDASGGALPGASVSARHLETGILRTTTSDSQGRFAIAGLPLGRYQIRTELSGFKPLVHAAVDLVVGSQPHLTLVLQVGGVEEELTVNATTPMINTSSSELSYLVGRETIDRLPLNGRNYTDLAMLQPGVNPYPHRD